MAKQKFRLSARNNQQLQNWILLPSIFVLVLLLCTACEFPGGTPPPPEEGVLITGEPNSLAADNLSDLPPVGVDQAQIENGIILTRLDVWIAPDATVAQINDALGQVDGGIVSMSSDHLFMTVAVPRQADFESLRALAKTLSSAAGIRYASIAREMVTRDWPFPAVDTLDYNFAHHLVPARFPAAWNLRQRLVGCESKRVPVLIADKFSPTPPGNFTTQVPVPGFPGIVRGNSIHGYYMTSIIASKWDTQDPTGANPFIECLDLRPIDVSGFSSGESAEATALAFPPGKFIINASIGFVSDCNNGGAQEIRCASGDITNHIVFPLERANAALVWKLQSHLRWNDFIAVVSAGNQYDLEVARIYAGLGEASYDSYMSIVAREHPSFNFVENGAYWDPSASFAAFPSLVIQPEDLNTLQTLIRDTGMNSVPPAPNVLIVGSTTSIVGNFPDMINVTESSLSNRNPDMMAVGENMRPTCLQGDGVCTGIGHKGTSYSAPQVSGLIAYLWLLSDELRERRPASVTRDAILANTRPLPSGNTIVDAYAAALSLDATSALSPTSTPNRFALLDVAADIHNIKVDEHDIEAFLAKYFDMSGNPEEPSEPDFSRHDLNGDGYTGGPRRDRFDLDRTGSIQFGASVYSEAILVLPEPEGEVVYYDENAVTDLDILCYYMYSDLYTGDIDRRTQLLTAPCLGNIVLPDPVTLNDGQTQQFETFLLGEGEILWTADGGTITNTGLYTAGGDAGTFTVRAARGDAFAEAEVTIDVAPQPEPTLVITPEPEITPDPETTPELGPDQVLSEDSITIIVDGGPPPNASFTVNLTALTGDGGTQTHAITYPPGNGQQLIITINTEYRVTIPYTIDRNGSTIYWTLPGCGPQLFWRPNSEPPGSLTLALTGEYTYVIHC